MSQPVKATLQNWSVLAAQLKLKQAALPAILLTCNFTYVVIDADQNTLYRVIKTKLKVYGASHS